MQEEQDEVKESRRDSLQGEKLPSICQYLLLHHHSCAVYARDRDTDARH